MSAAFDEKAFVARLETLFAEGRGEQALDYLIDQAGAIAASSLHRRVKLNHLRYASRLIENQTSAKHGFEKLGRKIGTIATNLEGTSYRPDGTFLDFGCGGHDPLGLATAFWANGHSRSIACDLRNPDIPLYSALSMFELVSGMRNAPHAYTLPGVDPESVGKRIRALPVNRFWNRDFAGGVAALAGKVDYRLAELTTLDVEDGELGFAVSFAVLEHVDAPRAVYDWLFRKTRPGALQFHFIDLADHRTYRSGAEHDFWSFLTEPEAPPNVNRLRANEHLELIEAAGFEFLNRHRKTAPLPESTRARLLPPWRNLPAEEIETIGLSVLLRRPA